MRISAQSFVAAGVSAVTACSLIAAPSLTREHVQTSAAGSYSVPATYSMPVDLVAVSTLLSAAAAADDSSPNAKLSVSAAWDWLLDKLEYLSRFKLLKEATDKLENDIEHTLYDIEAVIEEAFKDLKAAVTHLTNGSTAIHTASSAAAESSHNVWTTYTLTSFWRSYLGFFRSVAESFSAGRRDLFIRVNGSVENVQEAVKDTVTKVEEAVKETVDKIEGAVHKTTTVVDNSSKNVTETHSGRSATTDSSSQTSSSNIATSARAATGGSTTSHSTSTSAATTTKARTTQKKTGSISKQPTSGHSARATA